LGSRSAVLTPEIAEIQRLHTDDFHGRGGSGQGAKIIRRR
jgi:hypothetical protein